MSDDCVVAGRNYSVVASIQRHINTFENRCVETYDIAVKMFE